MSLRRPQMVLFDLDGTLVDTLPDLARCIDMTLQAVGMPPRGEDRVRRWIGSGIDTLLKCALMDDHDREPDVSLYQRAWRIFMDIYAENSCVQSRLYPGVTETLAYLRNNRFKLGCITNKPGQFTGPLLKTLGIYDDFGIVVAGDTLPRKKPDPLPLLHAAGFFSVKPEHALMVGDSDNDVNAARAAGLQVLGVSYGYNHGRDISDSGPDGIIDTLTELQQLI
ncbi:MAG: phosphoglycolate phosphatase [Gammaproteobacteria bacterium]